MVNVNECSASGVKGAPFFIAATCACLQQFPPLPPTPLEQGWASRLSGVGIIFPDHYKETRCLQLPAMPNEFGVCMVYGRCCTGCDGARQA